MHNELFPPIHKGIVTMEIDLIQNKPTENKYELRIIDTCTKEVEEEVNEVEPITQETITKKIMVIKRLGTPVTRIKVYTYEELEQLSKLLRLNLEDFESYTDYINELFRKGLLIITQKECQEGKGMYFSESQDWEIVRN
ncbi:hypothetical protein PG294_07195 [Riemerella anatipestifer]|uniref:hypothetical protein n=1 Tax=Riemerella anatipestifer TaxID=34085 RepID=UPI0012ADE970|nr:hypothetical protein [Riemerella anatipestifer]MCQ4155128.1 hypothetical protein [Riemerella anatipestifer]MDR7775487.1 hypothetical protein [Riemerella anatipestifer]MDR7782884.1 hypothetical protein [Riemerella anatipestifer]MDY3345942.1 hypothetical protein [Riemerella anatipestifer]MDY3348349.1 hypothetical protein [Riemerella anatipestifer]